jgi:hypothetical protein
MATTDTITPRIKMELIKNLLREQLEGCRRRKGNMTSHVQSMIS